MSDGGARKFHCGDQKAASWRERAACCVDLLAGLPAVAAPGSSLADIGCGDGKLQDVLRERGLSIAWYGYDLHPQAPGIATFDVRTMALPRQHTVAVLLGVLDYLAEPLRVLERLQRDVPFVVLSHVVKDPVLYPPTKLAELGWVTHVSVGECERLVDQAGMVVRARALTPERRTSLLVCERRASGMR